MKDELLHGSAKKEVTLVKNLSIKLGPVYSCLASSEDVQGLDLTKLPVQWRDRLRQHQAQTWQAYEDPTIDVIFNTALTGDGKSLAGQIPMLVADRRALLMYPTNELIRDQEKQVQRYLSDFGLPHSYQMLYSEQITEEIERIGGRSRSSVIINWLKNRNCILSNPDLFHLMSSFSYGSDQDKREFVYLLPAELDYFLLDEFHIFGQPQVISIANIMNYHKVASPHQPVKYVFLSATPGRLFRKILANSGFRVKEVKGSYSPFPAPGYTQEPIVQPVTLNLHSLSDRGAYAWAEEHLAELIDFYKANPEARGVFIVNSVATAKRLTAYYRRELQENGINLRVGENTGLTNPDERLQAMESSELIIATSTVDIGVDFKINLLIFESSGIGTFIQRLGRLGRHSGWHEYRAYALLPDWTVDRFAAHFPDGADVERVHFLEIIQTQEEYSTIKDNNVTTVKPIFQPDQDYRHYARCWGGVQTAHIVVQAEKVGKQWKSDLVKGLCQQYNHMYSHSKNKNWVSSQIGHYLRLTKDPYDSKILAELNAFRGRSPLDCGIFDETDQHFKTYNLFFLLANTRFRPISEAQFKQMVEEHHQKFERYRSRDLKLYVILEEYIEEREQFNLACSHSFKRELNQVHVYDTFTIQDSRTLATHLDSSVNDRLSDLELVCLVTQGKPADFKRENRLNPLFPVYSVKDHDNMQRSVIFGLNAFLAHSLVCWKSAKNEDDDELFIL
jgi:CRISPR-associated endonuclease/helicase Cas3